MTRKQAEPTIDDIVESRAATSAEYAIALALLRLADAADRHAEAHESVAESLATMAKTVRIRQS